MIPKIIHQTWKTKTIPHEFQEFQQTWIDAHPDWEYRLWTDADLEKFVHDNYNYLYPLYRSYRWPVQRVDVARYLIMEKIGGLYVDLDFECIRPFDPFMESYQVVLGQEPTVQARQVYKRPEVICNALLGSVPNHPLWEAVRKELPYTSDLPILHSTGPGFFDKIARPFTEEGQYGVYLAKPDVFYPKVAPRFPQHPVNDQNVWAIHHWANTWV